MLSGVLPESQAVPWNGRNEDRTEGAIEPFWAAYQKTPDVVAQKAESHRPGESPR